ncbi:MAG: hypothetical protein DPW09_06745 [Anaerolineae bacterium]|nr:S8 family serine peptidase [Anaerolineales bacterium]MCQ3973133.1 hypothetical protein [Anaerolineae bacterium]
MRRLIPVLLFSLVLFFSMAVLLAWPTSAQEPDSLPPKDSDPLPTAPAAEPALPPSLDRTLLTKIEPQLLKKLLQNDTAPVPFIVYLNTTTNLAAATSALGAQNAADPLLRRTAVVNALQQTARNTQAGVLQTLSSPPAAPSLTGQGQISAAADIRPLWIVNAVAAKGSLDLILTLAARPDVQIVRLDKEVRIGGDEEARRRGGGIFTVPFLQPSNLPLLSNLLTFQPSNLPTLQSSPEWGIVKIRANLVHQALGITGAGVVVANIDTGVDWAHPALQTKYRGYTGPGKLPQHLGNWFDATGEGATYPVDGNGHGSHTMGTMVGDNGIGVAPGAKWIAVKAFDSSGGALDSWLHSAFQWMLAPNGNPALAPNLVNNSWSSNVSASTEFQADIQALLSAGIYPIFAAGNNGPDPGTVGSPGSLNIALAVGATDSNDQVALFSSRGPSPWGKIKPEIAAPGKEIRSTLPGGAYGYLSGTSMAAPHVAGVVALMLQASPTLSGNLSLISTLLTSTAVALDNPIPNNNSGWGRIDAYNAVMAAGSFGTIQGAVTQAGFPIGGATIQITPHGGGPTIYATTAATGAYAQGLAPGVYDVTASAFGYNPVTEFGLTVVQGVPTVQNFNLTRQPTGALAGVVRETGTGLPLAASITIAGTPAQTTSGVNGSYSLSLPEGVGIYTATVVAAAHRITQVVGLTINDGGVTSQDFWLDPAPKILLVDSGPWYQESEIGYYQQALTDLRYPYDTWSITKPFVTPNDVPVTSTLTAYDVVIWSAPFDSPGYVGADAPLRGFLSQGGKLLLSGQDVAFFDGGGSIFGSAPYFRGYLKAQFLEENGEVFSATGVITGPFAGLSLTIAGGDGANNQTNPDVIENVNSDFARNLLTYGNDNRLAGVYTGLCVPYRVTFLPFGFEAINSRADRSQTLARTLDWLLQPPAPAGVEVTPAEQTVIGNFGAVASHTVRVRNIGAAPATFNLSLSSGTPHNWPVNPAPPPSLSLTSCQSQTITMGVQVNVSNSWHVSATRTLTVQAAGNPAISSTVTRTTKSPAPVLLVDDDRWYSFAAEYKSALEANQIPYDYWLVPKSWSGAAPPSPPLATLQMYPMTIWYTAYDWFQPLLTEEEDRLAAYLNGGGRLLLSSQDYIYGLPNHKPSAFAQNYLGVLAHIEDYSSTHFLGQPGSPVGTALGPYPLDFPLGYDNWTDALTPTASARIAGVGQEDQPNSLTNQGVGSGGRAWHTNFMAFGPEVTAPADRARLLQRSVGWLSWLGASTVTPNVSATTDGTDITYTAMLTNDGWNDLSTVAFTATFPAELTFVTASPEMSLVGGELIWSGPLARNTSKTLTYTASLANSLPLGARVNQVSWLAYPDHNLRFDRVAQVQVNFPQLSGSTFTVTPATGIVEGDVLTYTVILKNDGPVDDPLVTTTNTLPAVLEMVAIDPPSQGTLVSQGKSFTWTTPLAQNQTATLTYRALVSYTSSSIRNRVTIDDDLNDPLRLTAPAFFKVQTLYLPIIRKK